MDVAAAGIALFQLLDRVIQVSKHIIDTVKDAPNDIQLINSEIVTLQLILKQLRDSGRLDIPVLTDNNGPLRRCQTAVEELEILLPREAVFLSSGKRRKTCEITFATLAWVLKESKAKKLLAEISQQKGTILLGLSGSMVQDIRAIKDDIDKIREAMKDNLTNQTRDSVLDWLQSTNPSAKHNASFQNHEPETSHWIHQTPEWQAWLSTDPCTNFLWLHGIPGCGKTVLASYLIEQVKEFCGSHEDVEYAFYYCVQNTQDETEPFLRWVVSRLCRRSSFVPEPLIAAHNERCEPPIKDLLEFLRIILHKFNRVFIILDAVDESKTREKLLRVLRALSQFQNVQLLATSRNYYDIETTLADVSTSVSMSNPLVNQDIRLAVRSKLDHNQKLQKWRTFFPEMEDAIANGAQGMFRWAVCQLHILERLQPTTDLHEELKNLPPDLDTAYEKIFQQIPERHQRVVRKVLLWIFGHDDIIRTRFKCFTDAPIPLRVLVAGTSADLYEQQCLARNAYDSELLRDLCGCLVDVQPRIVGKYDLEQWQESKVDAENEMVEVVSCAHYTVKEYLYSERIRSSSAAYFALEYTDALLEFARSIFTQALTFTIPPRAYRWLDSAQAYAVASFGHLAKHYPDNRSLDNEPLQELVFGNKTLTDLICRFLDPSRPHYKSLTCLRNVEFGDGNYHFSYMAKETPQWELPLLSVDSSILANLVLRGMHQIAEDFIKDKDVKELCATQHKVQIFGPEWSNESEWKLRSCSGTIPIILASSLDSPRCFEWFLEYAGRDIDVTSMLVNLIRPSDFLVTEVGLNLLLELGADPNAAGYALTPLQLAAWGRNITAIEILLEHNADHQAKGMKGGEAVAFFKEDIQDLCPWTY
ncbi:hypothetical protein B0J13DRAFT_647093 [Dactylonectria estremocensis]|uniref:NACHT domain-containing protein n=1 Tax=Dactylonectria estremocensis TaxID=1079267 RepID=A0A9P9DTY7_9HYPO|nr:hypothetical protein B0J13DRAFT_647093 [Dactylonectria estremocensis]